MSFINYLPRELQSAFLLAAEFIESSDADTACVCWSPPRGKFIVDINPEFWKKLSEEEKQKTILHELSHVIRGDLLIETKDLDKKLLNYATDSIINKHLKFEEAGGIKLFHYDKIKKELKLPDRPTCWQDIYEKMKQNNWDKNDLSLNFEVIEDEKERERARQKIIETILTLPENTLFSSSGIEKNQSFSWSPVKKSVFEKLTNNLYGKTVIKKRIKSYRRERNGLKSYSKKPVPVCSLFVDVSGSMSHYKDIIAGFVKELIKNRASYNVYCFSDNLFKINKLSEFSFAGGGTNIEAVIKEVNEKKLQNVIIFSDCEFDALPKNKFNFPKIIISFESSEAQARYYVNQGDRIIIL